MDSDPTVADISLEIAHLYLHPGDETTARAEVAREARFVRPLLTAFEEEGHTVSVCALVDDTGEASDSAGAMGELILSTCAEQGIKVDYLVNESTCGESIEMLDPVFYPEIPPGAAGLLGTARHVPSVDPVVADEHWLENGEPGRDHPVPEPLRLPVRRSEDTPAESAPVRGAGSRGTRTHSIHLDVELWSRERQHGLPGPVIWACPMLASWWQLLRLGAPTDETGLRLTPEPTSADAAPFVARSTLTVLPTDFISIEHAVRTILGRVALPESWLPSHGEEGNGDPLEHLQRINYVFVADLPRSP